MLPAPDFRGVIVAFWAMMSMPVFIGAIIILLAGCTGVEAGPRLGKLRYLVAMTVSGALGWLTFGVIFALGLWIGGLLAVEWIPSPWQFLYVIILIMASTFLGASAAYQAGRLMNRTLIRRKHAPEVMEPWR
jgi:hypothetical protein